MVATTGGRSKALLPAVVTLLIIVVAVAAGVALAKGKSGSESSTSTSSSPLIINSSSSTASTATSTATSPSTSTTTGAVTGGTSSSAQGSGVSTGSIGVINIVAAENFWGSLVSQIAGVHGNVTSIVTNPSVDPHEYQSNPANAKAIADARLVIINGMDYDVWAQLIINASDAPGQTVVNVQKVVGISSPTAAQTINGVLSTVNPHLWYSPYYVNDSDHAFYDALVKIDPADQAYFKANYATLNSSLYHDYMQQEEQIKAQWGGTPYGDGTAKNGTNVASTESIFIFMANATGLNIVTPQTFMKATAEVDDPSPSNYATFQQQLAGGPTSVACLVYNVQTVTPVTEALESEATQYHVPTTYVSETIDPPDLTFQSWMQGEVAGLQSCLTPSAPGQ